MVLLRRGPIFRAGSRKLVVNMVATTNPMAAANWIRMGR